MYLATPLSYYISAIISTGLAGVSITCAADELVRVNPPQGQTCGSYLNSTMNRILNPNDKAACEVCMYATADTLLAYFGIFFTDRWWQWAVTIAYNAINVMLMVMLYWMVNVPKRRSSKV